MRIAALTLALLGSLALATAGLGGCDAGSQACERVCTSGRACGDTCISASSSCNTPPGSACNG